MWHHLMTVYCIHKWSLAGWVWVHPTHFGAYCVIPA